MHRSVFISYSHADGAAVRRDAELLRAGGVQVFIDVRDIAYGERWRDVLRESLLRCERVLVFWSAAARVSEWVDREWRFALGLGKKIVPTLLDATPLPAELADFQAVLRFEPPPRSYRPRHRPYFAIAATALAIAGAGAAWWLFDAPPPAMQPVPDPLPGASAPLPLPAPVQTAPGESAGLVLFGGLICLVLLALWAVRKRARPRREAHLRHAGAAAAPDAEARRFVEAVFAA